MALTYFGELATQAGTSTATLTWPGSVQAGDLAVGFTVSKLSGVVPASPTDWTRTNWTRAVGSGADAVDAGLVRIASWWYVLPSASPANPVFNVASGNALLAHGLVFRKGAGDSWDTPVMTYADRPGLSTVYAASGVDRLGVLSTDFVAAFSGVTRNAAITSGRALTIAGITGTQTQVAAGGTNNGNHLYAWTDLLQVNSGVDSAGPVTTATFASTQAGGTLFARVGIRRTSSLVVTQPPELTHAMTRDWGLTTFAVRDRSAVTKINTPVLDPTAGQIWPRGNR